MLGTLGSAITTLVLLLILVEDFSADYARKRAQGDVHRLASNMASALNFQINERINDLQLLAHWSLFREQSIEQQRAVLATLAQESRDYRWLLITSPEGVIRTASLSSIEGLHIPSDPWFPPRFPAPVSVISHPESPPKTDAYPGHQRLTLQCEIAVPLNNRKGLLDSWLIASLLLRALKKMARNLLDEKCSGTSRSDDVQGRWLGVFQLLPHDPSIRQVPDAILRALQSGHAAKYSGLIGSGISPRDNNYPGITKVNLPVGRSWSDSRHRLHGRLYQAAGSNHLIGDPGLLCPESVDLPHVAPPVRPLGCTAATLENPGCVDIPQSNSYAEVILLSRVLAEMRQLEQQDLQALAELNQTLEAQVTARTQELDNVLLHAMNAFISINEQGKILLEPAGKPLTGLAEIENARAGHRRTHAQSTATGVVTAAIATACRNRGIPITQRSADHRTA